MCDAVGAQVFSLRRDRLDVRVVRRQVAAALAASEVKLEELEQKLAQMNIQQR